MRIFEILTIVGLLCLLIEWVLTKRSPILKLLLSVATLASLLLHLILEGARWQMIPIYILVAIFLVGAVWDRLRPTANTVGNRKLLPRILGSMFGLLLLVIGAVAGIIFPVPNLPVPDGSYAVGTMSFVFTDDSRPETFTPATDDKRLIYVQVWYPAGSTENFPRTHMWIDPAKVLPNVAKSLAMPAFLFDHLTLAMSNSYLNAPLSEQEIAYPALVFSHAYYPGFFAQNTVQMEELASHGYIIFSIGHAYEGAVVFDAQGQAISGSDTQVNAFFDEVKKTSSLTIKYELAAGAERIPTLRALLDASPITQKSIQIWTQDTQFVLTQIEQMNSGQVSSPFAGHLDTSRMGVFGMSFGGATAAQVCAIDSRCKVAINMDGFQFGTLLDDPLKVPFMMMESENQAGTNDLVLDTMTGGGIRLVVRDTQHFNYTDFNLVSPVFQSLRVLGNIDPQRMEHIINTYTLAFFDQTLKGIPSPLLQGDNPDYPEVALKVFAASSK